MRISPPSLLNSKHALFTGIIQHVGRVDAVAQGDFGVMLCIDPEGWNHRPEPGESIAVNGCCLTVAQLTAAENSSPETVRFDVVRQTLDVTTLGKLARGSLVNLERAVTPQTMLGGHIVQGHVDGVGTVVNVLSDQAQHRLRIEPFEGAMELVVERGSIAVDGVSLTIAAAGEDWFEVALIPTTLRLTNLGSLQRGSSVNVETDYIAKTVVNWLRRRESS